MSTKDIDFVGKVVKNVDFGVKSEHSTTRTFHILFTDGSSISLDATGLSQEFFIYAVDANMQSNSGGN